MNKKNLSYFVDRGHTLFLALNVEALSENLTPQNNEENKFEKEDEKN